MSPATAIALLGRLPTDPRARRLSEESQHRIAVGFACPSRRYRRRGTGFLPIARGPNVQKPNIRSARQVGILHIRRGCSLTIRTFEPLNRRSPQVIKLQAGVRVELAITFHPSAGIARIASASWRIRPFESLTAAGLSSSRLESRWVLLRSHSLGRRSYSFPVLLLQRASVVVDGGFSRSRRVGALHCSSRANPLVKRQHQCEFRHSAPEVSVELSCVAGRLAGTREVERDILRIS